MDQSLRRRVRAGDHAAFAELFDGEAGAIYRYALRVSADRTTAEEVVSQTFLEAWRLRRRVRPDGDALRPWLFGIAVNVLRNALRAERRRARAYARLPLPAPARDVAEQAAELAREQEELGAAQRALAALRPREREVVALCIWSQLSYADAAHALGVPVGTVRSRLSRARARLQCLAREELQAASARVEPPQESGQSCGVHTHVGRPLQERES